MESNWKDVSKQKDFISPCAQRRRKMWNLGPDINNRYKQQWGLKTLVHTHKFYLLCLYSLYERLPRRMCSFRRNLLCDVPGWGRAPPRIILITGCASFALCSFGSFCFQHKGQKTSYGEAANRESCSRQTSDITEKLFWIPFETPIIHQVDKIFRLKWESHTNLPHSVTNATLKSLFPLACSNCKHIHSVKRITPIQWLLIFWASCVSTITNHYQQKSGKK